MAAPDAAVAPSATPASILGVRRFVLLSIRLPLVSPATLAARASDRPSGVVPSSAAARPQSFVAAGAKAAGVGARQVAMVCPAAYVIM